jgi:hypothetical protein
MAALLPALAPAAYAEEALNAFASNLTGTRYQEILGYYMPWHTGSPSGRSFNRLALRKG